LGDAPKEVPLGGGGMSFLRLDLRDFLLAALARGAAAFFVRFDFDFLARAITTSVSGITNYHSWNHYKYLFLFAFNLNRVLTKPRDMIIIVAGGPSAEMGG